MCLPKVCACSQKQQQAANVHVSVLITCTGGLNMIGQGRAEYLQSQVEDHCCRLEAACGCLMCSGSDPARYCSACFCHISSHPLLDTSHTSRSAEHTLSGNCCHELIQQHSECCSYCTAHDIILCVLLEACYCCVIAVDESSELESSRLHCIHVDVG